MMRLLHRWPGLIAALLLLVLSISGAALSLFPAAERLSAPQIASSMTIADLAAGVATFQPPVEQIRQSPSGKVTAYWFEDGTAQAAIIDPATGQAIADSNPNPVERFFTVLHRSLFLGDAGRLVMAAGAFAMLVLSLSGASLVARRTGGWKHWFSRLRGPLAGRLHTEIARIAVVGLIFSSASALWMSASTFDLLPDGAPAPIMQTEVSGLSGFSPAAIALLQQTPASELRSLTFPDPEDASDVFTLKTKSGTGYLDQGTGEVLAWSDLSGWEKVSETIYMLHTGRGAATVALVLGIMALGVPAMAVTGFVLWFAGWRARPRIRDNVGATQAETIVLVGSEGGSTWGFAATLHAALTQAGQSVHAAPLSAFAPHRYQKAKRILILAATYGDGDAPSSAKGFIDRLNALSEVPAAPLAVLGFGDRSFAAYCGFAQEIVAAARARGWQELTAFETVDRQSPQDFARWGRALGSAIGLDLELAHQPVMPQTQALTLVSRRDYGAEVQAPTAILRFALPQTSLWQRLCGKAFGSFRAGDLIGILPQGSAVPRFYSLASGTGDGFVEIVIKKHPNGLCSGQLFELAPGDQISAFLRRNPGFHAGRDRTPLILIGAGTGIGPLAGFVRANRQQRPIHLFFGMRHPMSDFLYDAELADWQKSGQLQQLATACSRQDQSRYVQDALRDEAAEITRLIAKGARIMVCGGRGMANGVAAALDDILTPAGLTPALLKTQGRYVEDVY